MSPLDRIPGIVTVESGEPLRDWRDTGQELEYMGKRLDAIRRVLSNIPKTKQHTWKYRYWTTLESQIFKRWQMMDLMKLTGMRTDYRRRIAVDYSWWEESQEIGSTFGFTMDGLAHDLTLGSRLAGSWHHARDESFQRARKGLA
jgi:hypothetical protein